MSEPSILDRIQGDLAAAMKSRDADTLSTLRMLKAAILEEKTRKARDQVLGPDEEIAILQRYAKKRRETIEELRKAGREGLVAKEEAEIAVTGRYLPAALSDDELREIVREVIAGAGAAGPRDSGRVIGAVMARVKGRADGGAVSRLVQELLKG